MRRFLPSIRSVHITTAQWVLLLSGVSALGVSLIAMAVTTEDVTQHNGLASTDAAHLRFFVDHRTDTLISIAKVVTNLGDPAVLLSVAVCAAALLWWWGARVIVAVAPAIALGAAAVIATIAKSAIGRVRPPTGVRLIAETEPSFPSGHSTDSSALFIALALVLALFVLRRPITRVAVVVGSGLMAAAIGTSRLVLGVHWPSDVLVGWALGTATALVVTLAVVAITRVTNEPEMDASPAGRVRGLVHILNRRRTEPLQLIDLALP